MNSNRPQRRKGRKEINLAFSLRSWRLCGRNDFTFDYLGPAGAITVSWPVENGNAAGFWRLAGGMTLDWAWYRLTSLETLQYWFLAAGSLFLVGSYWIFANSSGWRRLARIYPKMPWKLEKHCRFRTARVGFIYFGRGVNFGMGRQGLRIRPGFFDPLFPAVMVPWKEIRFERVAGFLTDNCRLTFPSCPGIAIKFDIGLYQEMHPFLAAALDSDSPKQL